MMGNCIKGLTNDPIIRKSFLSLLRDSQCKKKGTMIIEEMGLQQGKVRADLVLIDDSMHGYEIKSDLDTLKRLPTQLKIYSKVFEFMTIVTGQQHLEKVKSLVPPWWGIDLAEMSNDKVVISTVREASKNPEIAPESFVQLLWRDEALSLLGERGLEKGFKSKPKYLLWRRIVENIPLDELKDIILQKLKSRTGWKVDLVRNICAD